MKKISFITIVFLTYFSAPLHAATENFLTATFTFDVTLDAAGLVCASPYCTSITEGQTVRDDARNGNLEVGQTYNGLLELNFFASSERFAFATCTFGPDRCSLGSNYSGPGFSGITGNNSFIFDDFGPFAIFSFQDSSGSYSDNGDLFLSGSFGAVQFRADYSLSNVELALKPVPLPAGLVLMLTGMATLRTFGRKAKKKLASQGFASI